MDKQWYWKIDDGRIWGSAEGRWLAEAEIPQGFSAQALYDSGRPAGLDYLRETVKFYGLPLGELAEVPDLVALFTEALQARLDNFARTRNYDSILSAASYATSSNSAFAAEGQYAAQARDATWAQGYAILAEVQAGQRPLPTMADVLAELPELVWPAD